MYKLNKWKLADFRFDLFSFFLYRKDYLNKHVLHDPINTKFRYLNKPEIENETK